MINNFRRVDIVTSRNSQNIHPLTSVLVRRNYYGYTIIISLDNSIIINQFQIKLYRLKLKYYCRVSLVNKQRVDRITKCFLARKDDDCYRGTFEANCK